MLKNRIVTTRFLFCLKKLCMISRNTIYTTTITMVPIIQIQSSYFIVIFPTFLFQINTTLAIRRNYTFFTIFNYSFSNFIYFSPIYRFTFIIIKECNTLLMRTICSDCFMNKGYSILNMFKRKIFLIKGRTNILFFN